MNTLFIVGGISIAIVAIFLLFDYLKSKNINAGTIITDVDNGLKKAENYTEAAVGLTTGKLKKVLEGADAIEKLAITGCGYAEQMFISGQITDDPDGSKRKGTSLNYIYTALKNEGIDITDNVKTIATGIVENTVLTNKPIQDIKSQIEKLVQGNVDSIKKSNDSLQAQVTKLTTENTKLKSDNSKLEQRINTIKSATDSQK